MDDLIQLAEKLLNDLEYAARHQKWDSATISDFGRELENTYDILDQTISEYDGV